MDRQEHEQLRHLPHYADRVAARQWLDKIAELRSAHDAAIFVARQEFHAALAALGGDPAADRLSLIDGEDPAMLVQCQVSGLPLFMHDHRFTDENTGNSILAAALGVADQDSFDWSHRDSSAEEAA